MAVAAAVAVAAVAVTAVADVVAVAAVTFMTNMPIAHYHNGNISEENALFFGHAPLKIRHS